MLVDSYRFLPRSFLSMYDNAAPLPGEAEPVWAPFVKRLAESRIALLTTAGLSVAGEQKAFDLDRERSEPTWGDPTCRFIPHGLDAELEMSHLHVNSGDVLADRNVALPIDVLNDLVGEGRVGSAAPRHVSVMGYQQAGLEVWRAETVPQIIDVLRDDGADGVILAPV